MYSLNMYGKRKEKETVITALLHLMVQHLKHLFRRWTVRFSFYIWNCALSEKISSADHKVFWGGALFKPPDETGFAPAVTKIFTDTKARGDKTLGPKLPSAFDKKQGPGSHSAQAS